MTTKTGYVKRDSMKPGWKLYLDSGEFITSADTSSEIKHLAKYVFHIKIDNLGFAEQISTAREPQE